MIAGTTVAKQAMSLAQHAAIVELQVGRQSSLQSELLKIEFFIILSSHLLTYAVRVLK